MHSMNMPCDPSSKKSLKLVHVCRASEVSVSELWNAQKCMAANLPRVSTTHHFNCRIIRFNPVKHVNWNTSFHLKDQHSLPSEINQASHIWIESSQHNCKAMHHWLWCISQLLSNHPHGLQPSTSIMGRGNKSTGCIWQNHHSISHWWIGTAAHPIHQPLSGQARWCQHIIVVHEQALQRRASRIVPRIQSHSVQTIHTTAPNPGKIGPWRQASQGNWTSHGWISNKQPQHQQTSREDQPCQSKQPKQLQSPKQDKSSSELSRCSCSVVTSAWEHHQSAYCSKQQKRMVEELPWVNRSQDQRTPFTQHWDIKGAPLAAKATCLVHQFKPQVQEAHHWSAWTGWSEESPGDGWKRPTPRHVCQWHAMRDHLDWLQLKLHPCCPRDVTKVRAPGGSTQRNPWVVQRERIWSPTAATWQWNLRVDDPSNQREQSRLPTGIAKWSQNQSSWESNAGSQSTLYQCQSLHQCVLPQKSVGPPATTHRIHSELTQAIQDQQEHFSLHHLTRAPWLHEASNVNCRNQGTWQTCGPRIMGWQRNWGLLHQQSTRTPQELQVLHTNHKRHGIRTSNLVEFSPSYINAPVPNPHDTISTMLLQLKELLQGDDTCNPQGGSAQALVQPLMDVQSLLGIPSKAIPRVPTPNNPTKHQSTTEMQAPQPYLRPSKHIKLVPLSARSSRAANAMKEKWRNTSLARISARSSTAMETLKTSQQRKSLSTRSQDKPTADLNN